MAKNTSLTCPLAGVAYASAPEIVRRCIVAVPPFAGGDGIGFSDSDAYLTGAPDGYATPVIHAGAVGGPAAEGLPGSALRFGANCPVAPEECPLLAFPPVGK